MSHLGRSLRQRLPPSDLCNRSLKAIQRWKRNVFVSEMEVILDGWLIKLNLDRRLFKKKTWNRYWFVLRHSAHNAGEVILEYYKDSNCHNLRGQIDLSECEQLDSGLLFGKDEIVGNGFDVRTANKIYYLVAETEVEMNKWVGCISTVCGLKLKDGDGYTAEIGSRNGTEPIPPPVSLCSKEEVDTAVSMQSPNPYILISECFTGKPIPGWPNNDNLNHPKETDFNISYTVSNYDYPRPTSLQEKQEASSQNELVDELYKVPPPPRTYKTDFNNKIYTYFQSPSSDDSQETLTFKGVNLGNDIYLYNDGPEINHEDTDIKIVRKEASQLTHHLKNTKIVDGVENEANDLLWCPSSESINETQMQSRGIELCAGLDIPPPRPPKPQDLHKEKAPYSIPVIKPNNILDSPLPSRTNTCIGVSDIYLATKKLDSNNASQEDFKTVPILLDDLYDVPKLRNEDDLTMLLQATGSHSEESFHAYDNAPPAYVKSQSTHEHEMPLNIYFNAEQSLEINSKNGDKGNCCDIPPLVNRNLKPKRTIVERNDKPSQTTDTSSEMGSCTTEIFCNQDKRNIDLDTTVERPLLYDINEVQYLDLNLDDASDDTTKLEESQAKRTTIYKTVDFLRTEAFNKTRQNVEEVYRKF